MLPPNSCTKQSGGQATRDLSLPKFIWSHARLLSHCTSALLFQVFSLQLCLFLAFGWYGSEKDDLWVLYWLHVSFKYKYVLFIEPALILQVILCGLSLKPYACGTAGGLLGMLHYFSKYCWLVRLMAAFPTWLTVRFLKMTKGKGLSLFQIKEINTQ